MVWACEQERVGKWKVNQKLTLSGKEVQKYQKGDEWEQLKMI